jgi:hypothetical protein
MAGTITANYVFSRSMSSASYCRFLLPIQLLSFDATAIDKKVSLSWRVGNPGIAKFYSIERMNDNNHWTLLTTIAAGDTQQDYDFLDTDPVQGYNVYRLRITEKTNEVSYSGYRRVFINVATEFNVFPNPASGKVIVRGKTINGSQLYLSDVLGKPILQLHLVTGDNLITLPLLAPGIYLLRVNEKVQKLIIH